MLLEVHQKCRASVIRGCLPTAPLFVVMKGVEKSQLANKAARRVFGLRTSLSAGLARMMLLCLALSAFLDNTPVVALLTPPLVIGLGLAGFPRQS